MPWRSSTHSASARFSRHLNPIHQIQIAGGEIDLVVTGHLAITNESLLRWIHQAAENVTGFLWPLSLKHLKLIVTPAEDGAVQGGKEFDGERIEIHIGADTKQADLDDDWMLTHEMFHLSQPDLDDKYSWMSEGMADYLEPVSRSRNGQIKPEKFWQDLVEGLPKGLPEPGDRGLDHAHTWRTTYWGGSLHWLLADIRIRQPTHNQKSVRDAALAALNAGGDGFAEWSLPKLLDVYDRGTGTRMFSRLHDEMGSAPDPINLPRLMEISRRRTPHGNHVTFDDNAFSRKFAGNHGKIVVNASCQ